MNKYRIAGLIVEMQPNFELLKSRSESYLTDSEKEADITIHVSNDMIELLKKQNPNLTVDECEYLLYGLDFYQKLPDFDAILLHSSCVAVDGYAYLFSAPCGTGKSTHTSLWKKHFGDRLTFINDDKPALRLIDGKWYAYGTPWCGKDGININMKAELAGICFLKQAPQNKICRLDQKQAISNILWQTIHNFRSTERLDSALSLIENLVTTIPVYEFENLPIPESAELSYNTMRNGAKEMGL